MGGMDDSTGVSPKWGASPLTSGPSVCVGQWRPSLSNAKKV